MGISSVFAHHADLGLSATVESVQLFVILASVLSNDVVCLRFGPNKLLFPIAKVRIGVKSLRNGHQSPGQTVCILRLCFFSWVDDRESVYGAKGWSKEENGEMRKYSLAL